MYRQQLKGVLIDFYKEAYLEGIKLMRDYEGTAESVASLAALDLELYIKRLDARFKEEEDDQIPWSCVEEQL